MLIELGKWIGDIWLEKGDTVSIVCKDQNGEEVMVKKDISKRMHITEGTLYQFEDEFDLKEGYAGVIGNKD